MSTFDLFNYWPQMRSYFKDSCDTDYDREIDKARQSMSVDEKRVVNSQQRYQKGCECATQISSLINTLQTIYHSYYPRPCIPGACLGLMTPHRSRIMNRIHAFEKELELHQAACEIKIESQIEFQKQRVEEQEMRCNNMDASDRETSRILLRIASNNPSLYKHPLLQHTDTGLSDCYAELKNIKKHLEEIMAEIKPHS